MSCSHICRCTSAARQNNTFPADPAWLSNAISSSTFITSQNEHAESGERGEPTHSTSQEVIFLRGVGKGNRSFWLVVRLVCWLRGVQGLICFSDGGGSQQLSLFRLRLCRHPTSLHVSLAPHLFQSSISLSLIPMPTMSEYPISFSRNYESFQGSFQGRT